MAAEYVHCRLGVPVAPYACMTTTREPVGTRS